MMTVVGNVANYLETGISFFINNILKESSKLFQVKILEKMLTIFYNKLPLSKQMDPTFAGKEVRNSENNYLYF